MNTQGGIQQTGITTALLVVIGLVTGYHQPAFGMAVGTFIAGAVRFLYRRYKKLP